jgi:hypothetical protein
MTETEWLTLKNIFEVTTVRMAEPGRRIVVASVLI